MLLESVERLTKVCQALEILTTVNEIQDSSANQHSLIRLFDAFGPELRFLLAFRPSSVHVDRLYGSTGCGRLLRIAGFRVLDIEPFSQGDCSLTAAEFQQDRSSLQLMKDDGKAVKVREISLLQDSRIF